MLGRWMLGGDVPDTIVMIWGRQLNRRRGTITADTKKEPGRREGDRAEVTLLL